MHSIARGLTCDTYATDKPIPPQSFPPRRLNSPSVVLMAPSSGLLVLIVAVLVALLRFLVRLRNDPLKVAKEAHWSARYSGVWIWWQHLNDRGADAVHQAHLRYGPVVRLGPSELSVCAVEGGLDTIYSFREPMLKTDWYQVANSYGEQPMVALVDEASHKARRKMLAQPYQKTSIRRNQRWLDAQPRLVHDLLSALDKLVTEGPDSTNFFDLAFAWSVDSITGYLFGTTASLNLLTDIPRASRTRQEYDAQRANQFLPLPTALLKVMGMRPEIPWIQGMQQAGKHETNTVFQHFSQNLGLVKTEQKPVATADGNREEAVASAEMQDHMIAGIDPVDMLFTACAWQLSLPSNQDWQLRLHEELRLADCPRLAAGLETLQVLDAIIKEVLRVHVPLAGAQPRMTPKPTVLGPSGHEISVPAGVTVHSQAQTLHRTGAFEDAERFDPKRWLDSSPNVLKEMDRWYWPFGSGTRACIGSQLGLDNLKLAVATLYGAYRTETVEGSTFVTSKGVLAMPLSQGGCHLRLRILRANECT